MSGSRLKGKRKLLHPVDPLEELHIKRLPDMMTALRMSLRPVVKVVTSDDRARAAALGSRPVDGDEARLKAAIDASEPLIEEVLALHPPLARRPQWKRSDEGEFCDPGLLYCDDEPFFQFSRQALRDSGAAGEPVRVVISTDDKEVKPGTAAAFIAAARIVQQFRPLEIWWQGSWLSEDRRRGYVFLVPLVQGDMDFSRLEFCINDKWRDHFSWRVMTSHAVHDLNKGWNGCGFRANMSYLMENNRAVDVFFVSHTGIRPEPDNVCYTACRWLGWDDHYDVRYAEERNANSAAQSLPEPSRPYTYTPPSKEQRMEQEKREREWRERAAREAAQRLNVLDAVTNA